MNLKKIGKELTNKSVGTGPSSYEKRIYQATASQTLRNTCIDNCWTNIHSNFAASDIAYPNTTSDQVWWLLASKNNASGT